MITATKNLIQIFFLMALALLLFPGIGISGDLSGGKPCIGRIALVSGHVVIVHADSKQEYPALKGVSLYKGDTLTTSSKSRISIRLNDESIIIMGPDTKLTLSRSIYDPDKRIRATFLKMTIGKARFWVKKLIDYKHSDFRIKTPTAVAGVRGSDFTVFITDTDTLITAFENTVLEIASVKFPDAEPFMLRAFEQTCVRQGEGPSPVLRVPASRIEKIKREFPVARPVALPKKPPKPAKNGRQENAPDFVPKIRMTEGLLAPAPGINTQSKPQGPPRSAIIREQIAAQKKNARRPKEIVREKPPENNVFVPRPGSDDRLNQPGQNTDN